MCCLRHKKFGLPRGGHCLRNRGWGKWAKLGLISEKVVGGDQTGRRVGPARRTTVTNGRRMRSTIQATVVLSVNSYFCSGKFFKTTWILDFFA
jgi:hypothetical protein